LLQLAAPALRFGYADKLVEIVLHLLAERAQPDNAEIEIEFPRIRLPVSCRRLATCSPGRAPYETTCEPPHIAGLSRRVSCQGTRQTHRGQAMTRTGSTNSPSHGPNEMAKVHILGMAQLKREPRIEINRSRAQEICLLGGSA
jgi:hypothetical protein